MSTGDRGGEVHLSDELVLHAFAVCIFAVLDKER